MDRNTLEILTVMESDDARIKSLLFRLLYKCTPLQFINEWQLFIVNVHKVMMNVPYCKFHYLTLNDSKLLNICNQIHAQPQQWNTSYALFSSNNNN